MKCLCLRKIEAVNKLLDIIININISTSHTFARTLRIIPQLIETWAVSLRLEQNKVGIESGDRPEGNGCPKNEISKPFVCFKAWNTYYGFNGLYFILTALLMVSHLRNFNIKDQLCVTWVTWINFNHYQVVFMFHALALKCRFKFFKHLANLIASLNKKH